MTFHYTEFLRQQARMTMTDQFENSFSQAVDFCSNAPAVASLSAAVNADPRKPSNAHRTTIYTRCQRLDMNTAAHPVGEKKLPGTQWSLFWAEDGGTKELLLIGRWVQNQFYDWFGWTVSAQDNAALQGLWNPPQGTNNSIDMTWQGNLVHSHNDKHFGAEPAAAQYTIGATMQVRKRLVAGMEDKAINHGMVIAGEAFFRFNAVVGTDGQYPQLQSTSIRVDTPLGPSQHSHPIPENQAGTVSHDGKIKTAVRTFTVARDIDELVKLAKYLRVIGSPGVTNLGADEHLYNGMRPPASIYWAW